MLGTDELFVVTGNKEHAGKKEYEIDELLEKRWILREKGSGTREVFLRHLGENITTGIYVIFRGLYFEPDADVVQNRTF